MKAFADKANELKAFRGKIPLYTLHPITGCHQTALHRHLTEVAFPEALTNLYRYIIIRYLILAIPEELHQC